VRYVGLVFLGLVLWAGQAVALEIDGGTSKVILEKGKIVHERYDSSVKYPLQRVTRVFYRGNLFICTDYVQQRQAFFRCFDDRPAK
jgi:hypothetical protein